MCTVELTSAAADLVTALATLGAVVVAGVGLHTWKKELKGRADFETARVLARDTYALREALAVYRTPFYSAAEFPNGDTDSAEGYAIMFQNRWRHVETALAKFESSTLEAEALWGEEIRQKTERLRRTVVTVFVATESFVEDKRSKGKNFDVDPEFGMLIRSQVAASRSAGTNATSVEIAAAVGEIESSLKQHLSRE